jgi:oxygen-independent coproporphyrinogen-3 oxidase
MAVHTSGGEIANDVTPAGRNSLGVYVQVPFCQTKCTYCNFHTGPAARSAYAPYVRAVEREIHEHRELYRAAGLKSAARAAAELPVDTIYIGGGTPSLLDPADLARMIAAIDASFGGAAFSGAADEVTLEADPETIDAAKANAWRAAGVNRISMGAQSFNDIELAAAGRMHRRKDIFSAVEILRRAGFANIGLDLIAGLPHQTDATWQESLGRLVELRPEHVSVYLLEIDEESRLGREVLSLGSRYGAGAIPSDDAMAGQYERACEVLAAAGYEHYEISNWALPGLRSRHNLKYWRREAYVGFGAGAHSFDGEVRWSNAHDIAEYVASIELGRLPVDQRDRVTRAQALEEEMFLGLRQLDGIDLPRIETRYGVSLAPRIEDLRAQGLVLRDGPLVRLAPDRLTVSNEVFVALLGEEVGQE